MTKNSLPAFNNGSLGSAGAKTFGIVGMGVTTIDLFIQNANGTATTKSNIIGVIDLVAGYAGMSGNPYAAGLSIIWFGARITNVISTE